MSRYPMWIDMVRLTAHCPSSQMQTLCLTGFSSEVFFILMKWLKFHLNKNKNSPDATLISSRLSYMSSDMVWIRIKTRNFKREHCLIQRIGKKYCQLKKRLPAGSPSLGRRFSFFGFNVRMRLFLISFLFRGRRFVPYLWYNDGID